MMEPGGVAPFDKAEVRAGAGVPADDNALRDMALRKLALYFYENRSADERTGYPDPPPDLNALILNLRY